MDDGRVGPDADSALFLWIGNRPPVPDTAAPEFDVWARPPAAPRRFPDRDSRKLRRSTCNIKFSNHKKGGGKRLSPTLR
jgi:hypothetical protein